MKRLTGSGTSSAGGLANGRTAVVAKIHHALADGVASANLIAGSTTPLNGL